MSGSGATCFAICADADRRDALAGRLAELRPGWWVRACRLAGFQPPTQR
jgi:4-diphosphocytidyl-2-C-methyl-D-erythritol kinase